jgi:hypothetical protein
LPPDRIRVKSDGAVLRAQSPKVLVLAVLAACSRAHPDPSSDGGPAPAAPEGAGQATTTSAAADGGAPIEEGEGPSKRMDGPAVYPFALVAPVFSATEWPAHDPTKAAEERRNVARLGYLRRGSVVAVKKDKIEKGNCPEGWWELVTGGFVCGKYVTPDPKHPELKNAPHPPFLDKDLPYDYALNLTPGTPLYRRLPLRRERKEYEKTLAIGKNRKTSDVARELKERGEEVPSYLRDNSVAKPTLGFDELKGESALVVQRMLKGFYLSIDRKIDGQSGPFWRTAQGMFAPKDHVILHEPKKEFEGVRLDAPDEKRKLPFAFVVGTRARQTTIDDHKPHRHDHVDRFSFFNLTGKREAIDDRVYYETDQSFWLRDFDVAVVSKPQVPNDIQPGEKWIDIDLSGQSLVAFEGDKPVYATVVSTGRHDPDPAKDHKTVEGSFRIREKHVSTTMDDDAASDGTYRIEDVPWVMYFEKSYALHGAFWHSRFGREKSHGCVNLTPHDARWIFMWAGPTLPEGWHGVRATKENPGTRVIVHK